MTTVTRMKGARKALEKIGVEPSLGGNGEIMGPTHFEADIYHPTWLSDLPNLDLLLQRTAEKFLEICRVLISPRDPRSEASMRCGI